MNDQQIAFLLFIFLLGTLLGASIFWLYQWTTLGGKKRLASKIISEAELKALEIKRAAELMAEQKMIELQKEGEKLWLTGKKQLQKEEERFKQREDKLEARIHLTEKKLADLDKREAILVARKEILNEEKETLTKRSQQLCQQLEQLSGLSSNEAKEILLKNLDHAVLVETAHLIRKAKKEAEEEAEHQANKIITTAINRLAVRCTNETTVCTAAIPNEEMKGRIIGREGRNIRALENATGVNFIIDDTPGTIVISGFDPVRKYIAKMVLNELVKDGRIHPAHIEEIVEKVRFDTQKQIKQYGEDAALRAGAMNLHPELFILLGKLKFRYSYGQNVLEHSLEVSHLMGLMAAEMGLDTHLAKRIGLLHDIGKAVTHEVEGSHALIGYDFALKYGESEQVANGIGCHHREMEPLTIEADLCSAADAISASREGARSEAIEEYIKRLKKLEDLAYEFKGIEKAYAMQAGREIRVMVLPDQIDDNEMTHLARDLTNRIEKELNYPGKVKITLIREKRIVKYAV